MNWEIRETKWETFDFGLGRRNGIEGNEEYDDDDDRNGIDFLVVSWRRERREKEVVVEEAMEIKYLSSENESEITSCVNFSKKLRRNASEYQPLVILVFVYSNLEEC